jgi:outer membrane receptor protein involved in Fe transport
MSMKDGCPFLHWDIGNFEQGFAFSRHSDTKALMVELTTQLANNQQLIAGISYDTGEAKEIFSYVRNSEHTTKAVYIQDEITLGAFLFTTGIRYDRIALSPITVDGVPINGNSSVDHVLSPRLGVTYRLDDATSFYSSIGSAFLPAQNKFKFVQPSADRVDNPDLDPEKSISFEVGMRNKLPFGKLRSAIYRTNFRHKIVQGLDPVTGLKQWQNRSLRKVLGVEIAYEGDLGSGWYPYANYTHIKAEDQAFEGAEFTEATRVSPNKFNLGFTYEKSDVWSASFNGRWVDSQHFFNLSDEQKGCSYFQVDAQVRLKLPGFNGKLDGYLAVNNITDKKYNPYNVDEWSDGRTISVGVNGKY